jgi:hypothetical protein
MIRPHFGSLVVINNPRQTHKVDIDICTRASDRELPSDGIYANHDRRPPLIRIPEVEKLTDLLSDGDRSRINAQQVLEQLDLILQQPAVKPHCPPGTLAALHQRENREKFKTALEQFKQTPKAPVLFTEFNLLA